MQRIRRPRNTREIIRFWWAIYRELQCNRRLVGGLALEKAMADSNEKYRPWGDLTAETFDAWWKSHREMFIEQPSVEDISKAPFDRKPHHLYLSINLQKPPSKLIPPIMERIKRLQKAHGLLRENHKRKARRQAQFRYNEGAEIHLPTFREQYRFFKYVYIPVLYPRGNYQHWGKQEMESTGGGQKLWKAAVRYYRGKKKPQYLRLSGAPTPSTLRNLRRYIQRINILCERVAHGQFP
jgi:hypothetical protein